MDANQVRGELTLLNNITNPSALVVSLDIARYEFGAPLTLSVYGSVNAGAGYPRVVCGQPFDNFSAALDAAGRAVSLFESCRIVGDANPGEGDFVKHLGR